MSKKLIRLTALLLIPSMVLTYILTDQFYRAKAQINHFPAWILTTYPGTPLDFDFPFAARLFLQTEMEGINQTLDALGRPDSGREQAPAPKVSAFINNRLPLPLLMHLAYRKSDTETCLRLASLWKQHPADLFRCAAQLDSGRLESAGRILDALGEEEKRSWLGQRISRLYQLAVNEGDPFVSTVFDRRGIPLGNFKESRLEIFPEHAELGIPRKSLEDGLLNENPLPGKGVRFSLDLRIQEAAAESLAGYRGTIVVLDSHTGEVLASASDARTLRGDPSAPFHQQYEPASISKLVTTSAALRSAIDVDEFMSNTVCNGGKRYSGKILWCSYRSGRLGTLAKALADSCNIAFADLGVAAGRKAILEELEIFGFERPPTGPFHFGEIVERRGDNRQLADLSIGLESTTVTPVHAALLATPFANDGIMPEPVLLFASDGLTGLSPREYSRKPGSWIVNDPRSLEIIQDAMREVALNGTARGMSENGFPVAMKTGTGRTSGTGYVTNYIGYGPLPDTRISFCLRITHQPTSSRVRRASRAVLAEFLQRLSGLEDTHGAE